MTGHALAEKLGGRRALEREVGSELDLALQRAAQIGRAHV